MYDANGNVVPTSCALILHPGQLNSDGSNGLAVVPFGQNAVNKRRIRRPFSVAEVEILVEAVEKLGTGRSVFAVSLKLVINLEIHILAIRPAY